MSLTVHMNQSENHHTEVSNMERSANFPEFCGVCIRGITNILEPIHVPYSLKKMKGGVDSFGTGENLLFLLSAFFLTQVISLRQKNGNAKVV